MDSTKLNDMISAVISFVDGNILIHSEATQKVDTKFDPGFYAASTGNDGKMTIRVEKIGELHEPYKTKEVEVIYKTVAAFFKPEMREQVNKLGFTHKLGVLLYGVQGGGKTSIMNHVAHMIAQERDAIIFICNTTNELGTAIMLARMIREIQNEPIVFVSDEFDRFAMELESEMKNFLDGIMSVENTLFLASTNYLERVPKTLSDRPSRFRLVVEIKGITDKKLMKGILLDIGNRLSPGLFTPEEADEVLKGRESATLDELKHMCLNKVTNNHVPVYKKERIGFSKMENPEDEEYDDENFVDDPMPENTTYGIRVSMNNLFGTRKTFNAAKDSSL